MNVSILLDFKCDTPQLLVFLSFMTQHLATTQGRQFSQEYSKDELMAKGLLTSDIFNQFSGMGVATSFILQKWNSFSITGTERRVVIISVLCLIQTKDFKMYFPKYYNYLNFSFIVRFIQNVITKWLNTFSHMDVFLEREGISFYAVETHSIKC